MTDIRSLEQTLLDNCKSPYRLPNFVISFTEFTSQVSLCISDQRSHFEIDHLNHQAGRFTRYTRQPSV